MEPPLSWADLTSHLLREAGDLSARWQGGAVSKKRSVRGSKYTDAFKRHLVAESYGLGVTVLIVSK